MYSAQRRADRVVPVGAMSIESVVANKAATEAAALDNVTAPAGVSISVAYRDADGKNNSLVGWGQDICSAVAEALKPLAQKPFSAEIKSKTVDAEGLSHYQVLLRDRENNNVIGFGRG